MDRVKAQRVGGMLLAAAALALYAFILLGHVDAAAGGPDSSGYLNEARLLASGHIRRPITPLRTLGLDGSWAHVFTPFGFTEAPGETMVPTYPAGLPVHLAVAGMLGGWSRAPFLVVPLSAIGAVILIYVVALQLGLESAWAFGAAAALAAVPVMITHGVQPVSDVLATFWALATVSCALRGKEKRGFAVLAGVAFAIGVWVRPTNILMSLPLAFAMRWKPSRLALSVAAALPFGLGLMWLNRSLYGNPVTTGYGSIFEIVTLKAFRHGFPLYVNWILDMLTPLGFPIGLLVAFDWRADRWVRSLLVVWFAAFFIFYCAYDVADGWWCTRFVLPAFPALILGAMLLLRDMLPLVFRRRRWLTAAAGIILVGLMVRREIQQNRALDTLIVAELDSTYPKSIAWAERQLPPDALLTTGLLSGAFLYYGNRFTVRWDQLDNDRFQLLRAYALNNGLHWYAMLSDVEIKPEDFPKRLQADWRPIGRFRDITLYRLDH